DDAHVHHRPDHDEQSGEERQRLPLDVLHDLAGVQPGHREQQQTAADGDHRGLQIQPGVQHEGDHHDAHHRTADGEQPAVLDGVARVELHHGRDALGVVGERFAEHDPGHQDEHDHQHDDDRHHVDHE